MTFVDWDDTPRWSLISKALGLGVPEPLETYHTSPHLFTDLDIPEGTTGRLPRAKRTRPGLAAEVLEDLGGPSRDPRGRGRSAGSSRSRSGRARRSKDGDQTMHPGKQGRSDRGARGRGRGEHSPRAAEAPAQRAPRKRIRRRKSAE